MRGRGHKARQGTAHARPLLTIVIASASNMAAFGDETATFEHERLPNVIMTHPTDPYAQEFFLECGPNGKEVFVGPRNTFGNVPPRPTKRNSSKSRKKTPDPDWAVVQTLSVHLHYVCAVAFSTDGKTLASAAADGSTCIWNVADLVAAESWAPQHG